MNCDENYQMSLRKLDWYQVVGFYHSCQLEMIYYPDNSLVPGLNRAQALLINMNRNVIHSDLEQIYPVKGQN